MPGNANISKALYVTFNVLNPAMTYMTSNKDDLLSRAQGATIFLFNYN